MAEALGALLPVLPEVSPDAPALASAPPKPVEPPQTFMFDPATAPPVESADTLPSLSQPSLPPPPPASGVKRPLLLGGGMLLAGLSVGLLAERLSPFSNHSSIADSSEGIVVVNIATASTELSVELLCPESDYRDIDPIEDGDVLFSGVPQERCVLRTLSPRHDQDAWFAPVTPGTRMSCVLKERELSCDCEPLNTLTRCPEGG